MSRRRVFILGPGLAGATELAKAFGRIAAPPFVAGSVHSSAGITPHRESGSWACSIENVDLVIRLKNRGARFYDALRDAAIDPEYAAEAEFLRTLDEQLR